MTVLPVHILFAALTMHWVPQTSNSQAGLRGLAVVSPKIAWASGTNGTVLRTVDGGEHWEILKVGGAEALDFRDVEAFDAKTAFILASGLGEASRLYLTTDGGELWTQVLNNPDRAGFFDALKFWDRTHGILLGDPVAGRFTIYTTEDGGLSWVRTPGPSALPDEGAFAASGTCLAVRGNRDAWFGTGGPNTARVFHTADRGRSWSVSATPMSGQVASSGIFSLAFLDSKRGVAVGGDYQRPEQTTHTVAVINDEGDTWTLPGRLGGFRSAVTYVKPRRMLVVAGTTGSDYSLDGGITWHRLSTDNLNAVASNGTVVWAVGPKGAIVKLGM